MEPARETVEVEMEVDDILDVLPTKESSFRSNIRSKSIDCSSSEASQFVHPRNARIRRSKSLCIPDKSSQSLVLTPTVLIDPMKEISDAVDAHVQIVASDDDDLIAGSSSTPIATMSVLKNAECYNMNHKNRGKCVIFNHEIFETGFEKREGSAADAEKLQRCFRILGFDVEVHNDLSHLEVMTEIERLSQLDHTDNDCLCVFVLTHGLQNDLICAKDAAYRSDKIWKPFTANKCITLAGKPKMFFFQACRGDEFDSGVVLAARTLRTSETDSISSYKIPTHADFLIAHSSVQGFYTWRNPVQGTWYIQCLCEVLDKYGTKLDLISMLTITARKVATDYASNDTTDITRHNKKQVPSVTTMLLRYVYFPPKSNV